MFDLFQQNHFPNERVREEGAYSANLERYNANEFYVIVCSSFKLKRIFLFVVSFVLFYVMIRNEINDFVNFYFDITTTVKTRLIL